LPLEVLKRIRSADQVAWDEGVSRKFVGAEVETVRRRHFPVWHVARYLPRRTRTRPGRHVLGGLLAYETITAANGKRDACGKPCQKVKGTSNTKCLARARQEETRTVRLDADVVLLKSRQRDGVMAVAGSNTSKRRVLFDFSASSSRNSRGSVLIG
jgi:hypothetical protein